MSLLPAESWPEKQLHRLQVKKVLVCGRRLHPPPYSHAVNFSRLEFPLRGCYENEIESDGKIATVRLLPGSALFAAPNCWNLPAWKPGLELMSLLFGPRQIGISVVVTPCRQGPQLAAKKFSVPTPSAGPVPHLLAAMIEMQAAGSGPEIFPELASALIRCLEDLLRRPEISATTGRAQRLLESVCVFLQSHYQNEITRDSVAEQFGVTPNHLSRLFKTHGYMTFRNYLAHVRIDRAKHLLRSYNLRLDEIAARCGYYDAPHFCHVFKRLTKTTPDEYRSKSASEKESRVFLASTVDKKTHKVLDLTGGFRGFHSRPRFSGDENRQLRHRPDRRPMGLPQTNAPQ
jgi:AraC-like DNA-binding protein